MSGLGRSWEARGAGGEGGSGLTLAMLMLSPNVHLTSTVIYMTSVHRINPLIQHQHIMMSNSISVQTFYTINPRQG